MESFKDDQDKVLPDTSSFDPLRAIYDPSYETDSSTKCHDNVERCVAHQEGRTQQQLQAANPKKKPENESEPLLERQFLPEQMAVPTRGRRDFKTVLKRMDAFTSLSGPLFVLKQCRDMKTRVRVWTRGPAGVRGVLTGFLAAFDKHWNLALTDVDEQFTRRRARKAPVTGGTKPRSAPGEVAGAAREWRVGESVFRILKIKRKVEICVRHVPQVLLRGEHVVMVAPESPNTDNTEGTSVTSVDTH